MASPELQPEIRAEAGPGAPHTAAPIGRCTRSSRLAAGVPACPTSPTRTAMSTSVSATHCARKNSSSGSMIWRSDGDHAGHVVTVLEVLVPLARRRRHGSSVASRSTGTRTGSRPLGVGCPVDDPVTDEEPDEEQCDESDCVGPQHSQRRKPPSPAARAAATTATGC